MTYLYRALEQCVLCGSDALALRVPLEPIPIATPNFQLPSDPQLAAQALAGVPLDLHQCQSCGHVQVGQIGNPELQYRDYVYTTALSVGLDEHYARYADEIVTRLKPARKALVVEIGSNDGTLLRHFKERGYRVIGVDPARLIAQAATAAGIQTVAEFFSERLARELRNDYGPAEIIIANNMIANVPDLRDFIAGIKVLLAPGGVFVTETQYGADVVERNLLDTVYHEHISYFLVKPSRAFFAAAGLELFGIERIDTKGGSIRMYAQHAGAERPVSSDVERMIDREESLAMFDRGFFDGLYARIQAIRSTLAEVVHRAQADRREVAGFGVSVGTTTLLAQFGLMDGIAFLVDDDPKKAARLAGPGYDIPILRPQALLDRQPLATIVFAWRYADAILKRHEAYLQAGGTWLIPLPDVRTIEQPASRGIRT